MELENEAPQEVNGFHDLEKLCVSLFVKVFKEPDMGNIAEIIKLATHFPGLMTDEDNQEMFEEV